MEVPERKIFFVSSPSDVIAARRSAGAMAEMLGFQKQACAEIVLVVSELGSNLHKHATCGSLSFSLFQEAEQRGMLIEAKDRGPGIIDADSAMADGLSTSGTLGCGLGAINRLTDTLDIISDGISGTCIKARKILWNTASADKFDTNPYDIGAASRAYPGLQLNGDAFVIKHWPNHSIVAVIDGVGHGQFAHKAAQSARNYIETHYRSPLAELFLGAARACRATRGVVMTIIVLEWRSRQIQFCGVGNIETRMYNIETDKHFSVRRGIVGMKMPRPKISTEKWDQDSILILYSDGVSGRWSWRDLHAELHKSAALLATNVLIALLKNTMMLVYS